jgi:hypothetical protein
MLDVLWSKEKVQHPAINPGTALCLKSRSKASVLSRFNPQNQIQHCRRIAGAVQRLLCGVDGAAALHNCGISPSVLIVCSTRGSSWVLGLASFWDEELICKDTKYRISGLIAPHIGLNLGCQIEQRIRPGRAGGTNLSWFGANHIYVMY